MEHPDYKYQPRRKKSKAMSSSNTTPQTSRQSNSNNNNNNAKPNRTIPNQNTYAATHEYNDIESSPNHQIDEMQTLADIRQSTDGQLQNIIKSEMMYHHHQIPSGYNYNTSMFQPATNSHTITDYSTRHAIRHQQQQHSHHHPTDIESRCSSTLSDNSENESHPLTPPATPYTATSHHTSTSSTHLISTASPQNRNTSPSSGHITTGMKEINQKSQIYIDTNQPKSERYQTASYYDHESHRYYTHQLQSYQFLGAPSSAVTSYNINTAHQQHPHHHHHQEHQHSNSSIQDTNNFNQQIDATMEADVDPKELEQYLEPPIIVEHVRKLSNSYMASAINYKEQNNFIELQPTNEGSGGGVIQNYSTSGNSSGGNERGGGSIIVDSSNIGISGDDSGSGMVSSIPPENSTNTYYNHDVLTYQYHPHNWNGSHPI